MAMKLSRLAIATISLAPLTFFTACEGETPTSAVLENQYASTTNKTVYRAWWLTTYFDRPVAAGTSSETLRSVPATDVAYVLLAPGWDPASAGPPTVFSALKSKQPLSVSRGGQLRIAVSDAHFFGSCEAKEPLSAEDAAFIAERMFPGELAKTVYDPSTCTFAVSADADAGAGHDAAADAHDD